MPVILHLTQFSMADGQLKNNYSNVLSFVTDKGFGNECNSRLRKRIQRWVWKNRREGPVKNIHSMSCWGIWLLSLRVAILDKMWIWPVLKTNCVISQNGNWKQGKQNNLYEPERETQISRLEESQGSRDDKEVETIRSKFTQKSLIFSCIWEYNTSYN